MKKRDHLEKVLVALFQYYHISSPQKKSPDFFCIFLRNYNVTPKSLCLKDIWFNMQTVPGRN